MERDCSKYEQNRDGGEGVVEQINGKPPPQAPIVSSFL